MTMDLESDPVKLQRALALSPLFFDQTLLTERDANSNTAGQ